MNRFHLLTNSNKKDSILLWLLYNVLRIIPNVIFGTLFGVFYFFKFIIGYKKYKDRVTLWRYITKKRISVSDYTAWFKLNFKYKYDLFRGFCDHDSSIFEWFTSFGDCDDAALYTKIALHKKGIEAHRIGIMGHYKNKPVFHFDCIYITKDSDGKDVYTTFNYGRSVSGKSVEEALTNLGKANPCYLFDTTKYCMCLF